MERPGFKKIREYGAFGAAVVTLAAANAAASEAKPADKIVPLTKDQEAHIIIDSRAQVAGTYLQSANIKQCLLDAAAIGVGGDDYQVLVTVGGNTSQVDFRVGEGDRPEDYFYVEPSIAAIAAASGGALTQPGTVLDDSIGGNNAMESYIAPVDNSLESSYDVNYNIQTMASNAAFNVIGMDIYKIDVAAQSKILGFTATGAQTLELSDALKGALSSSFGVAEAAVTAGMSYGDYKQAIASQPSVYVMNNPLGTKIKVSLPAISKAAYYSLDPLKLSYAA